MPWYVFRVGLGVSLFSPRRNHLSQCDTTYMRGVSTAYVSTLCHLLTTLNIRDRSSPCFAPLSPGIIHFQHFRRACTLEIQNFYSWLCIFPSPFTVFTSTWRYLCALSQWTLTFPKCPTPFLPSPLRMWRGEELSLETPVPPPPSPPLPATLSPWSSF